ncbi:uncharacterized protein L201_001887 [Kwoniella dendrophila CBS 6074]|uniref:Uncharacterized protein n=1 Tax=Kwoniella dendrophila CBS 6074 TaxID=1295534 RepID=A0AAX4JR53_9TREE
MAPLKDHSRTDNVAKNGERWRRSPVPPIPLRSRQSSIDQSHSLTRRPASIHLDQMESILLYNSQANPARQAISLYEMPLNTTSSSHRYGDMTEIANIPKTDFRQIHDPDSPTRRRSPKLSSQVNTVTPRCQGRRQPVPSFFLNESFESLIKSTTPKSISEVEEWKPLRVNRQTSTSGPLNQVSYMLKENNIATPPTPNFGDIPPSNPSSTTSSLEETMEYPEYDSPFLPEPENSFEVGQDNLFDEVLTSWNLPPLSISRSDSLVLDNIPLQPQRPKSPTPENSKLSRSTGFLDKTRRKPNKIEPTPTFYPSGRSFEPIRAVKSNDLLMRSSLNIGDRKIEENWAVGRVKKAVEALEEKRDLSESPPSPWKEMEKLLQRKRSSSSMKLHEETRRMMFEARQKRSHSKPESTRADEWFGSFSRNR